jgi:uncharacterized repeat protein (TIGR04138 family)
MKTYVEFRSDAFPPYDGEDAEINPGRYGKRVAEFLVGGLAEKGFEPLEPVAEDWGWVVPVKNDGFNLSIGCGNYEEYPDGFLCFIEPHQPKIRRGLLWTVDTSARVTALQKAIDEVLSANPAVREKKWWTYDEFKRVTRYRDYMRDEPDRLAEVAASLGLPVEAVELVQGVVEDMVRHTANAGMNEMSHLNAAGFCQLLRRRAWATYGASCVTVLRGWGLAGSEDIGRIVFALVAAGELEASADDSPDDFVGLFLVDDYFA